LEIDGDCLADGGALPMILPDDIQPQNQVQSQILESVDGQVQTLTIWSRPSIVKPIESFVDGDAFFE
jgi:hypothetical protein